MSILDVQILSQSLAEALAGFLLRSSALIVAGALVLILLRSRTAELRHLVCHALLYGVLFLPSITWIAPPLRTSSSNLGKADLAIIPERPIVFTVRETRRNASSELRARQIPWMSLGAGLYVLGACTLLLRLLANVLRLHRLLDNSKPILNREFRRLEQEIWLQSLARYRPRVRVSSDVAVPLVAGIGDITILLPETWTSWSRAKLRAALIHEMSHVRRNDPQTMLLASFAACLFWPNPLMYWMRSALIGLAEQTCDEVALQDFKPEEYAGFLVEFAAEVRRTGGRLAAASAIGVGRPRIAARLAHIFSSRRNGPASNRLLRALLTAIFVPALYLTASARFDQEQTVNGTDQSPAVFVTTQEQADKVESDLAANPEDMKTRGALMSFMRTKEISGPLRRTCCG